ncbi:MAG TPA: ABC transporter permease [Chthoniobacterales bacterium]|jgi:predicted permease
MNDFRFAFRQLRKSPGFTIAAAFVLAFGIGANTAIFSLLDTLLFQPASFFQPHEIVQLFSQDKKEPTSFHSFSYPTYTDIRDQNTVFSGVMAHNLAMVGLGEEGNTRRAFVDIVSANYFSVLGVEPLRGRGFMPNEERPGSDATVAVVSYSYWNRHGQQAALLGSTITINARPFTIVGIMPEGFSGTMQVAAPEVWVPLGVHDQLVNDFQTSDHATLDDRNGHQLLLVARLKPGMTAPASGPALKTLAANLERAYPVAQKNQTFITAPLSRFSTSSRPMDDRQVKALAPLLMGMASVVLLVACLNLANMLLARGAARRKEIAIRLAVGASRWRIVRQLLSEGFVLALVGSTGGLVLGLWSSDFLVASLRSKVPIDLVWKSGPSASVLLATVGFCFLSTIAFALGPAMKLSRSSALTNLKENAGEDVIRRRWKFLPRNPLVVIQIAFSLALLTIAALFVHGARQAANVDTGLETSRNYLLELDTSLAGYDQKRAQSLYRTLEERLRALPGVEHDSISTTVPFGMLSLGKMVQRAGVNRAPGSQSATAAAGRAFDTHWNSVGADYFSTVGLRLLRGRGFTAAEATQAGVARVAIIDDVLAKQLWPEGDALGKQIQFAADRPARAKGDGQTKSGSTTDAKQLVEVVGIVPHARDNLIQEDTVGALYLPFAGGFQSNAFFHIRFAPGGGTDPAATTDLIRRAVREVDPALPILTLRTFAEHLDANLQLWVVRAGAMLFSIFGLVALGLAFVGVYGVAAYSIARRTREIGIRVALGAQPGAVQWMFLRDGFAVFAAGLILGLVLAFGSGRVVSSLLFQVSALDPFAFIIAPLILATATLLATWLPTRRALGISPLTALRTE